MSDRFDAALEPGPDGVWDAVLIPTDPPNPGPDMDDTIVNADIVPRRANLPAVRTRPDVPALIKAELTLDTLVTIAGGWAEPPKKFNRHKWVNDLYDAIREGDADGFKNLLARGLKAGFDGVAVSPDEFEVALLEFDAARAAR